MADIFYVGISGFFGAISRFLIYKLEDKLPIHSFPYGTLIINLLGCFLLGICLAFAEKSLPQHKELLTLFSIGYIGSFTTFSTFSNETLSLIQNQLWPQAFLNISLNIILGILLVYFGKSLLMA